MTTITPTIKERSETLANDQWNVAALYPSFEAWEKEFSASIGTASTPRWPSLAAHKGHLKEGPDRLKKALEEMLGLSRRLEKLYTYAHLRHDEEITQDAHKKAYQKIVALMHDFHQESSWFEPEILSLPTSLIDQYLQAPQLGNFRFYLEKIVRMRPHTLASEQEQLLAMAAQPMDTPPKAFSALNNADIKFGRIQDSTGKEFDLSHGLYQLYLRSQDRILREQAFKQLHHKYSDLQNTLCELLYGQVQSHVFFAKARRYPSALEAALYPKKIPMTVYHSLIEAVRAGLPLLHRYMSLRKKILQLPELHLYDTHIPLVPQVEIQMDAKEAEEVVIGSVAPLGSSYQNLLQQGLRQNRWVDWFENKNKRSGAYSSGCYDSYPYILMNYRGILRDVFTLAHEAGHSMHSYLSNQTQPYHYSHYPIFVAEVASTFNEELLMDYLLKRSQKKEERLFLINQKIDDIRSTLFRQTMFAEFELTLHTCVESGIPLTPTSLKEIYLKLNADYFGPDAFIDPEIAIEWARIPHFYYYFYVYQYATGISAALHLAEKVLSGDTHARDNYLTFLKGGSSLFPIDLLKLAGVDVTTSTPVQATLRKFESLLTELESLAIDS